MTPRALTRAHRCWSVPAVPAREVVAIHHSFITHPLQPQHAPTKRTFATLRRSRNYVGHNSAQGTMPPSAFGRLQEAYQHGENDMDDYLSKTSLSPWAPIPDAVARKVFDVAAAKPHDIHVDLGSGDGRVNFHAIDYGVQRSIGIDVDQNIVQVARDRLAKRHPPPDLQFYVADLLDENHEVWGLVQEATIITMYFAQEALETFRPLLEKKLMGRQCKIITCGYEMPGWDSYMQEVVLGTQIHLYEWGKEFDDDEDHMAFAGDDILKQKPDDIVIDTMESKFPGSNVIDRTGVHPIRGYDPSADAEFDEEFEADWEDEDDDDGADDKEMKEKGVAK